MHPRGAPRKPPTAATIPAVSTPGGVEAVDRALSLLAAFREGDDAVTLAELARRTGLYKSTALRLLASLASANLVERDANAAWRLGPELWRLGTLYRARFDLDRVIRPALAELVKATGETASFYVREGRQRICLYRHNSPRPVRHHLEEGLRLPLNRGAGGRVLLAFGGARGPVYDRIRREGAYVSMGERDPELGAASVPLFDGEGRLRGALSVSALISRFDRSAQSNALAALKRLAQPLGSRLPLRTPGSDL